MPKPRGPKYPVESRGPSYSRYLTKLRVRRHWTTRVKTHWKTRTTGSANQRGKPFPVAQKMQLPARIQAPPPRPRGVIKRDSYGHPARFPGEIVGRKPAKLLAYVVREGRQFMKLGPFESKAEASAKLFREKRNSPEAFAEKQGKLYYVMSPQTEHQRSPERQRGTRAGGAVSRDEHFPVPYGKNHRQRRSYAAYMRLLESRGGKVMEELSGMHYRAGERSYGGKRGW